MPNQNQVKTQCNNVGERDKMLSINNLAKVAVEEQGETNRSPPLYSLQSLRNERHSAKQLHKCRQISRLLPDTGSEIS